MKIFWQVCFNQNQAAADAVPLLAEVIPGLTEDIEQDSNKASPGVTGLQPPRSTGAVKPEI